MNGNKKEKRQQHQRINVNKSIAEDFPIHRRDSCTGSGNMLAIPMQKGSQGSKLEKGVLVSFNRLGSGVL
ncbi:uncharacterized protein EAF01_003801 [Botrytis porri]|uniref:uncharacterized protein n=1 Tax=Botrytis porri TaxID=87229 RepID=UPI0018FFFBCA|nr:uncharacterized protein EAF01_003801 [Botrytis porri]KAF7908046.1 hypothetical protein EAF01_003801 [Botrytis porri]